MPDIIGNFENIFKILLLGRIYRWKENKHKLQIFKFLP